MFFVFSFSWLCHVFSKNWISKNWKSTGIHWWTPSSIFIDGHPSLIFIMDHQWLSLMVHEWIWSPFFAAFSLGPSLGFFSGSGAIVAGACAGARTVAGAGGAGGVAGAATGVFDETLRRSFLIKHRYWFGWDHLNVSGAPFGDEKDSLHG